MIVPTFREEDNWGSEWFSCPRTKQGTIQFLFSRSSNSKTNVAQVCVRENVCAVRTKTGDWRLVSREA